MTQNEIEKLENQIAREAVGLLSMQGELDTSELSERAIKLIGQAWNAAPDTTQQNLNLIEREKTIIQSWDTQETVTHVLPEEQMLHTATGEEIMEMIWGCFETAIHLEQPNDRSTMYSMARYLTECFHMEEQFTRTRTQYIAEEGAVTMS